MPPIDRVRTVIACAAVALAIAVPAGQSALAAKLPVADREFVDATVAQMMREQRLPGVTVKISGPKGSYTRTYGVADLSRNTPMALTDHVRIASITKTFTATAILRQVQRGRLSLSDKLSRWVPKIPNARKITVRQLLAMRSGIYDFTSDAAFNAAFEANPLMSFKPRDIIPIIRRHKPLFAPGERTQYADSNYVLLGMILEGVTGHSAESVITRDVIARAGLRHTSFPTRPAMREPFSRGYYAGSDGEGPIRDYTAVNPKVAWTAGAMVSTVTDLKRWGRVLARGTLLSRKLQAERLRFGTIPNGAARPSATGSGSCASATGWGTTAPSSASAPSRSTSARPARRSRRPRTSRRTSRLRRWSSSASSPSTSTPTRSAPGDPGVGAGVLTVSAAASAARRRAGSSSR